MEYFFSIFLLKDKKYTISVERPDYAKFNGLPDWKIWLWSNFKVFADNNLALAQINPFPNKPWFLSVCTQESDILKRKYMIKCEKRFPSIYKETQGMQRLDYPLLHQDALPTQNHQRKKERSQFPLT